MRLSWTSEVGAWPGGAPLAHAGHAGQAHLRFLQPGDVARDLGELVRSGLTLEEVGLFDFFPQTSHIETAARLRR